LISNIALQNFKCFKNLDLPLGQLTLLAGLNGMGKSTVIQSILVLRQSFEESPTIRNLRLSGDLVDLGTGADVLYDGADTDQIAVELGASAYLRRAQRTVDARYNYYFSYDRTSDILSRLPRQQQKEQSIEVKESATGKWISPNITERADLLRRVDHPLFRTTGFQYLSAERLGPRKMLPLSDENIRLRRLGKQGEYVLHYLLRFGAETLQVDDPRMHESAEKYTLADQCLSWLREASPGARLDIEQIRAADAAVARFSFERKGDVPTTQLRPTNVGFGLSYILPVIVALVGAEKNDLVIIENPEAHLHPLGQTRLGQLAARAAASGVQVIIETHSDHFLDGVRIDVRERRIQAQATKIHYFEKEGAEVRVITPTLDSNGRLDEWPSGFFDQRDQNLLKLI